MTSSPSVDCLIWAPANSSDSPFIHSLVVIHFLPSVSEIEFCEQGGRMTGDRHWEMYSASGEGGGD